MKTPFLLLPFALLSISAPPAIGQDWSLQTKDVKSVFHLQSNEGHCSAVLVNEKDGILVTAAHCIPKEVEGRSITIDEKHGEVLKTNTVIDLALVKVAEIHGTAIGLRKDEVAPGLPVAVVGFGFAAEHLKFGFGWISDKRDRSLTEIGDRLYYSVVGTAPGDSGGAVIDSTGKLVSIVHGHMGQTSVGFGAPTNVLDDFVRPHWPKADRP